MASNDDSGGNDDHHAVNPKQTANRVMAIIDDLRYWSDIGYEQKKTLNRRGHID
ncbi:hypothetical protein [Klebsiella quasipneumoniae]|uniref:hypothetical protein n=1 Tax=Klebsiella quasipneumoniae TaxID=1463165 RepID=UPI0023E33577|nr:hypothetical protein [Klebsiella quasipneumoniae]